MPGEITMYKTPENAKEMLCPNNTDFLSHFSGLVNGKCIADKCMAWRINGLSWEEREVQGKKTGNWIPKGYCGIYGKPE